MQKLSKYCHAMLAPNFARIALRVSTRSGGLPCCRSFVAEVQCYSVDSRGYYSELQEFNFTAPLDLESPLKKWIKENADPVSVFIVCVL